MTRNQLNEQLPRVVDALIQSVTAEARMGHLDRILLPSRDAVVDCIKLLRQIVFPGYFGKQGLTAASVRYQLGELVMELSELLLEQVRCALRYARRIPNGNGPESEECDRGACDIVAQFLDRIPAVRQMLALDVQSHFDGDPAAQSNDEIIFCYPGLLAICVQRLAHEFWKLQVPLLPRIMTEHAHSLTGIDIHPGAQLGKSFFIDHGTGVVIGETAQIGDRVKVYQGVTLGALAPAFGQMLRGQKRHPTIEDDVTIYAGATILGGDTIIGKGAVIGGNVFLTSSVPAFTQVSMEAQNLRFRERKGRAHRGEYVPDFSI
jgi:serine O-acetyltransferase